MNNLIPIYKYCKEKGVSRQNLYRWIREGKVPKSAIEKKKVEVERMFIDKDFNIKK